MEIILPLWLSEELWESFIDHRESLKPKMTNQAEKLNLNKLIKLKEGGYDYEEIINTTIANGWKGFFKPNGKPKKQAIEDPNVAAGVYSEVTARNIKILSNMKFEGER